MKGRSRGAWTYTWEEAPSQKLIRRILHQRGARTMPASRNAGLYKPNISVTMRLRFVTTGQVGDSVALVGEDAVLRRTGGSWYAPTISSRLSSQAQSAAASDPSLFNRAFDAVRRIKLARVLLYLRTAHETLGCRYALLRLHNRYCRLLAVSETLFAAETNGMDNLQQFAIPAGDFVCADNDTSPLPHAISDDRSSLNVMYHVVDAALADLSALRLVLPVEMNPSAPPTEGLAPYANTSGQAFASCRSSTDDHTIWELVKSDRRGKNVVCWPTLCSR